MIYFDNSFVKYFQIDCVHICIFILTVERHDSKTELDQWTGSGIKKKKRRDISDRVFNQKSPVHWEAGFPRGTDT